MSAGGRKKIVVVEDEEKISAVLASQLELMGYDVHTETHGTAALRYAAEYQPDLVILDVKLPDVSGYVVCKELRKLYHRWVVPVLMITVMDQPIDQLRGFAHGADAYVTKPFDLTEVTETVARLLGETATA